MVLKLTGGRFNDKEGRNSGRKVVFNNEVMAKQFFANESPIGHRLDIAGPTYLREVVGVVSDVKRDALDARTPAQVYEPFWQNVPASFTLLLRTSADPLPIAGEVRRHLSVIDKDVPIANFRAMDEVISRSLGP